MYKDYLWLVIFGLISLLCLHQWYLRKQNKQLIEPTHFLHFRGNTTYVSPMAIMSINDDIVDPTKVSAEALDRVVRLRMIEILEGVNDPSKMVSSPDETNRLKRMATVYSAITGHNIHNSLVLVDKETKRLFIGIKYRMTLVEMCRDDVPLIPPSPEVTETLTRQGGLVYSVRAEFMNSLAKDDYDYFHIFVTKVRRRVRKHRFEDYRDEEIQSCVTAFAARTGLSLPRSYIRIDDVTSTLVHWDNQKQNLETTNVLYMTRQQ